jgi:hypothetical protein
MQFIKIIKKVRRNLIWVWNIAPIILLLEIWALVRVLSIAILIAGAILEMVLKTKDHSICSFF